MFELAEHICQTQAEKFAKRLAFKWATKNCLAPFFGVVNVGISRRDIEVTEHDDILVPLHLRFEKIA